MNKQEKAEQYAIERLSAWKDVIHSGYTISESTNGEVCVQDYIAGYDFAMSQPKHIFDGVAVVGDVRRFEGGLVDVVENDQKCDGCCLINNQSIPYCDYITNCDINNVKYVKR